MQITAAQLSHIVPRCREPAEWVAALQPALNLFEIDTPKRAAAFLAQCAHESQSFNRVTENLSYSAEGLMATWPSRFPTLASTAGYVRDPRALANKVYAGRMGNNEPNDGWMYRGRGPTQLTGKANYTAATAALGLPLVAHPEFVELKPVGAKVAGWFWQKNKLLEIADLGRLDRITSKITGCNLSSKNWQQQVGYSERLKFYARALEVLL